MTSIPLQTPSPLSLSRAGYKSIAAYSPAEALAALAELRPDLIISDAMMPLMNGVEFAIRADQLHPGIKVLLISGHAGTEDIMATADVGELSLELLTKPVLPDELLAKVAELLDSNFGV